MFPARTISVDKVLKELRLYRDPESGLILFDPVVASDGETYEREIIEEWLLQHDTSPMAEQKLENKTLIPNRRLKEAITQLLQAHPDLWNEVYESKRLKEG